ncbi:MAG: pyruvate kinase [Andreesenia angusta]|nr:pyruvate kinase [Andreesenia angusta]
MFLKKTKIVCTVGPASNDEELLIELMKNGLNVARLNFSHGTYEGHKEIIDTIKRAREKANRPVAIMLDTKGPEIRTGDFEGGKVFLETGQDVIVTTRQVMGNQELIPITYENIVNDVEVGNRILIDDGLIELKILEIKDTEIKCKVNNGGEVSNHKGINIPMVKISLPAVTQKDIDDIVFGIENEVDFIAASFVRKAQDVIDIRKVLEDNGGEDIDIISKIENYEGVENISEIVEATDGIMVARGDLGVEIPPEEVPLVQKDIIKRCNKVGKPVITATQMLDSMTRNPRPTRAEVTDVANSILDGTDAVMLSGETAIGKYPLEAVKTMARIGKRMEDSINYKKMIRTKSLDLGSTITESICFSASAGALNLGAEAILTPTSSGYTAKAVAKVRPRAPIIAAVQDDRVCRKLNLIWGVTPIISPPSNGTDELFEHSINSSKDHGLIKDGDLVFITAGIPVGVSGSTNMIKIHKVGQITIKGIGIGTERATGRVCVVSNINDFEENFQDGDIVVAISIEKAMIDYLKRASGIITEESGMTSNAAIVGLSLGIPVIVGISDIKNRIFQGETVTIDPEVGVIYKGGIEDIEE